MNPLFEIPDFSALSDDELQEWISEAASTAENVAQNPSEYVSDERNGAQLMEEMTEGVAAIDAARAELASRAEQPDDSDADGEETDGDSDADAPESTAAISDEEQEQLAALAARAGQTFEAETEPPADPPQEPDQGDLAPPPAAAEENPPTDAPEPGETASAPPTANSNRNSANATGSQVAVRQTGQPARLARPSRSRAAAPAPEPQRVALTAAAENLGYGLGEALPTEEELARMMIKRRGQFGTIPEGTHGEKIPIGRADWGDLYPEERQLVSDEGVNWEKVGAVISPAAVRDAFVQRRNKDAGSLVASGGLCAPVTPYYQLQMISSAERPVRAALASFNADRGGIRFARPAGLAAITTGVDTKTVLQDAAGGTQSVKACQVISCPTFQEVDIQIIHHCLQFGNVGARTFPELVAQWNQLVLAAHAREAETALLDGIASQSTQVTALYTAGFGASGDLLGQMLAAAAGMRSRHRMAPDAVLRALLPQWILDMLVSDVYRSQFGRFEMTPERFVALIRAGNIEPSFYLDGATGAGQVFGTQSGGALATFPAVAEWYLFPEGSFVYLDGGTLELGLVRDSDLNSTNDFQIFGETFENVAFVGVESLEIRSTICDSGAASLPIATGCPNYA